MIFEMRFSGFSGAPAELLKQYLVQARLDNEQDGQAVFLVRSRETGRMSWVKCPGNSEQGSETAKENSLAMEAQILSGLDHKHICCLDQEPVFEGSPFLSFTYWGQSQLRDEEWESWPVPDRVRMVIQLVDAVIYLQSQAEPVSHGAIDVDKIWYTPATRWLQLTGFNRAIAGADTEKLKQDRREVAGLAARFMPEISSAGDWQDQMEAWVAEGNAQAAGLQSALQQQMLAAVTDKL